MFFKELDAVDGHAPVHGLAHVVNGEQGHLNGRQGFHFHAGLPGDLGRRGADHARRVRQDFEFNGDTGQSNGVTQRNQIAGFLGPLNTGNAGNAQHIAFFGCSRGDQGQSTGQHVNATTGHSHTTGQGFAAHIDHVGLPLGIKMGQDTGSFAHGHRGNTRLQVVHNNGASYGD